MPKMSTNLICFLAASLLVIFTTGTVSAQDEFYRIEYTDIFGDLRRPAVEFPHDAHMELLEDEGCGACHHAPDDDTGELVYVEDEEIGCVECHGAAQMESEPALREAFHESCTGCHRQTGKLDGTFTGPTTCGECHNAI